MKLTDFIKEAGRQVAFFPGLARLIGREESIFVCQLIYWKREDRDWTWKTAACIERETSLSQREQRRVRAKLIGLGVLKEKLVQSENRMYFQIDTERLNTIWTGRGGDAAQGEGLRGVTPGVTERRSLLELKSTLDYNKKTHQERRAKAPASLFDSFEKKCAEKLRDIISRKMKIAKDARAWPKVFANMQRFDQITRERIKSALIWYGKHVGQKYVPVIEDAKDFRSKFGKLESRMQERKVHETPELEINDEATDILEALDRNSELSWPKGSRRDVPQLVQASLDAIYEFNRHRTAKAAWWKENKPQERRAIIHFDDNVGAYALWSETGGEAAFVKCWVRRINSLVNNWEDWSGKLAYYHFTPQHKEFRKMILETVPDAQQYADEYLRRMAK